MGIEPLKNITWTVFWIYLSIEAWKSWKWKALLPYPLFLVLTIISLSVVAATGSNYLSGAHISVGLFLNIGGLLTFYLLLRKTQNNQEIVAAQNRTKRDKQVVGDTESDFKKPIINTFPKKIAIKEPFPQSKSEDSKTKEKIKSTTAINENELYELIWKEIEENKTDIGLWAKCFAKCEGDENKTKALYVNERILFLKEKALAEETERQGCIKCGGDNFKYDKYFDEYICTDCGFSTREKRLITDSDVDEIETKNTNKMSTDYSDRWYK